MSTLKKPFLLFLALMLGACRAPEKGPFTVITPPAVTSTLHSAPLPLVEGPAPSYQVGAFYYPWYGNPTSDGDWIHWTQNGHLPPADIASDYMPALGAYSSNNPAVVAQHMAWLRKAGIGVIIVSWWGQGAREERPIPLILQMAQRYGIKVAFHIEPYGGRTADGLLADIRFLYGRWGSDPAFFLSTDSSRNSPSNRPKPMFFVYDVGERENGQPVQPDYWKDAVDAIHALPEGGLVIANAEDGSWVTTGHFDGLYNYITLHLTEEGGFQWAESLPLDSLYIPSVIPGNSANRVGYPPDTLVPRSDGATYNDQWTAALGTPIRPAMVTVTSFNEWHEGSMIEPIALDANNGRGYNYADFGALPPDGYLTLTRDWVDRFLAASYPPTYRVRILVTTSSDWTTLNIVSGGTWLRPELISSSLTPASADIQGTGSPPGPFNFILSQPITEAEGGARVEMTWDLLLSGLDPSGQLVLQIDRGNLGETNLTVFNYLDAAPVPIGTYHWGGIPGGRNSLQINIPSSALVR